VHKRLESVIAADDHGFCSGAQHQRKDRYYESPYDTGIFVLQNGAGQEKWPLPADFAEKVSQAMAKAVPTDAMKERRRNVWKKGGWKGRAGKA
jgi:phosphorylated CTD-interacting factor 1